MAFPNNEENDIQLTEASEAETEEEEFIPKDLTDEEVKNLTKQEKMVIASNLMKLNKNHFTPVVMMLRTNLA